VPTGSSSRSCAATCFSEIESTSASGRGEEDALLVEQRLGLGVRALGREVDDGQVEVAAVDPGDERGRGGVDQHDADVGQVGLDRLEQQRAQPAGGRPDHPHPHGAGDLGAQRGDVGRQRLQLGPDAGGPGEDGLALLGRLAGGPVDQRGAQLLLQPGDVGGDVRLHRVEGAGGGREAAVLGDGEEGVELAEVHRCE
jgi:hypothetical protein